MADVEINQGGKDRIHLASEVYKDAFKDDPVITYMLEKLSPSQRYEQLYNFFTALMTAAALNKGVFEEVEDWSAASVLMPPGERVDNPLTLIPAGLIRLIFKAGIKSCRRMLFEFTGLANAAKRRAMSADTAKNGRYLYMFFLATKEGCRGRGLGAVLVKSAMRRAKAAGVPLWLEATTEDSHRLYERCGMKTVEKMILGEGVAASNGTAQKGGEGVPMWAMVWWPEQNE